MICKRNHILYVLSLLWLVSGKESKTKKSGCLFGNHLLKIPYSGDSYPCSSTSLGNYADCLVNWRNP